MNKMTRLETKGGGGGLDMHMYTLISVAPSVPRQGKRRLHLKLWSCGHSVTDLSSLPELP